MNIAVIPAYGVAFQIDDQGCEPVIISNGGVPEMTCLATVAQHVVQRDVITYRQKSEGLTAAEVASGEIAVHNAIFMLSLALDESVSCQTRMELLADLLQIVSEKNLCGGIRDLLYSQPLPDSVNERLQTLLPEIPPWQPTVDPAK